MSRQNVQIFYDGRCDLFIGQSWKGMYGYSFPPDSSKIVMHSNEIRFYPRRFYIFGSKEIILKKSDIDQITKYVNPLFGMGNLRITHHNPNISPFIIVGAAGLDRALRKANYPFS